MKTNKLLSFCLAAFAFICVAAITVLNIDSWNIAPLRVIVPGAIGLLLFVYCVTNYRRIGI